MTGLIKSSHFVWLGQRQTDLHKIDESSNFMVMSETAIERAVDAVGGVNALAAALKCHPTIISKWRIRGVPAERVLPIYHATRGAVTPNELRDDLYPDAGWLPALIVEPRAEEAA